MVAAGSVTNAVSIMKHLAGSPPLGVNAIARAVDLNPSSCFNIVKALAAEEFLEFDPATKLYRIGPLPARLFGAGRDLPLWKAWLHEQLDHIASHYSLSCGLWDVRWKRVVLTDVLDSPLSTRIHLSVGQRLPAYIGAMGRCVAAGRGLGREEIDAIMSELRWQAPPTAADYWQDMQAVHDRGWALDDGRYLRGVATVAAAIADRDGHPVHCLTSIFFSGQFDDGKIDEIGAALAAVARDAEQRLRDMP
ncbi:MAG: hypothetical protein DI569_00065 [Sphingopyxis macrogoltabida]|uniref:IclR family transcriptional regulator n=1 Tax=Sphingopyxis macrogoltabida TaxID=33050 RepID=A0A2W5L5Y8_SPHMC|nr:MAG: hypothetical protein DI569_00065 [Sphingopyxis macrogoltabida]